MIANKDERVQALLVGKNYTVVGIAIPRPLPPPPCPLVRPVRLPSLLWCCESRVFYRIDIDITHEKVISVTQRS